MSDSDGEVLEVPSAAAEPAAEPEAEHAAHIKLVVNPSKVYLRTTRANMSKLISFPNLSIIEPTSSSGTDSIFTSATIPNMKSRTSLFVRVNNLGFNSYNAGTGSTSKILYSVPRFSNNGEESGGGLYFEPNERTYLPINNPADLYINEFSLDFVNENETLATDLTGKSVVILHIRPIDK